MIYMIHPIQRRFYILSLELDLIPGASVKYMVD